MTKTTKHVLSILLICAMLLTLLPVAAFAAEEVDAEPQPSLMERVRTIIQTGATPVPFGNVVQTGTLGMNAVPWRLYDSGILIVSAGHIELHQYGAAAWFAHREAITQIIFENTNTLGSSLAGLFRQLHNLTSITGMENWNTSTVTNMYSVFSGAGLTSIGDLSSWDTGNVTSMQAMFSSMSNLTSLDSISGWNTGNVTNMQGMFSMSGLTSLDFLSGWDTGNVTQMNMMFLNTTALTNVDAIAGWNTSNVTNMSSMFSGASGFTNLDGIANWDTGNVTNMSFMFLNTSSLTSLDLSAWNTDSVTNMGGVFVASGLTSLDISGWDTGSVTTMTSIFATPTLRELTLGPNFTFVGGTAAALPAVPDDTVFTGYWQNVGTGTVSDPQGSHVLTAEQLMETFDGATMADTWVWQPRGNVPRMIQLNRSGVDTPFDPQPVGYTRSHRFSTIVQNIGTAATGGLTVTISGPNASAFEITHISREAAIGVYYRLPSTASTLDLPSLAVGNAANLHSSRRFLIQPIAGLPAGTHTARVTVSVDAHPSGEFDEYFDVVFVVQ